ncbi:MAG: hypothetical protein FWE67_15935, partial [Planctomycetaceae bacterium]|nr:hypothetical protein [Planctomycetaceae bacterium]
KIKSPEFKVKTLVDLAEYVSRDSNYKKEADALYELAVAGIDALSEGKPVVVKVPETTAPIQAPKKQITLTDTPQEKPIEVKPVEIKPAMEPVETKPLTQLEVKPEGGKKLTIVDIDEEDKKPLPKPAPKLEDKPAEVKSVETKPTEPKPEDGKKLRIKIVDEEDEEPLPKPAPKLEDKPVETDMPKTTLPDTKEEPKSANVKPDSVKPEAEEVTPAESESATPTRKPMPRRKIVVTD